MHTCRRQKARFVKDKSQLTSPCALALGVRPCASACPAPSWRLRPRKQNDPPGEGRAACPASRGRSDGVTALILPEIVIRCKRHFRATAELCPATRNALDGGLTTEREPMSVCPSLPLDLIATAPSAPHPYKRRVRRPFAPSTASGRYSLPRGLAEWLMVELAGYRNRDEAMALAVFLARFWGAPGRHRRAFPIDRRALAGNATLGLTEARIRGALARLEHVGFVNRMPVGRTHQVQGGELHRRPATFRFGPDALAAFDAAHARQARTRQRSRTPKPRLPPVPVHGPSMAFPCPPRPPFSSPKSTGFPKEEISMGDFVRLRSQPTAPSWPSVTRAALTPGPSNVDGALARFAEARRGRSHAAEAVHDVTHDRRDVPPHQRPGAAPTQAACQSVGQSKRPDQGLVASMLQDIMT